MWDPRNYSDSDFGLEGDERFEPDEFPEHEIDITRDRHVMTVLGPVEPGDLGITQAAEHLLAGGNESEADLRLDDVSRSIEELTSFVTAGGKSIVDLSIQSEGRDLLGLLDIARRVPAHIICSTSVEGGLDDVIREIREGVGPRNIRPGVLRLPVEERHLSETLNVARQTRLPLFVGTQNRALTPEMLKQLDGLHVVIVDTLEHTDGGQVREWLGAGCMVLFGGIGRSRTRDVALARMIVDLESDGFGDQLLASQTLRRRSEFLAWKGQPGLIHLLERFTLTVMDIGSDAMLVRTLLIDNPARALTIDPA